MNCCLTVSALKLWCVQTYLLFVVDHVSEARHWQFPCSWASFATFIMSKSSRIVPFHSNNSWIALESIPSSQGRTKVLFQSHQQQRHFLFSYLFPLEEGSERKNTCWPNDQHLPLLKTNELACHLKSTYLAIWCHWHVCTLWRSIITLRNDLLFWVIPGGAQCLQNIQTLAKQIYCQYLSFFFLQNLLQNWHQIIWNYCAKSKVCFLWV